MADEEQLDCKQPGTIIISIFRSTTGYIFSIVFVRTHILTSYILRSVRLKVFKKYVVKCLLFSKPFSSSVPPKIYQIIRLLLMAGEEQLDCTRRGTIIISIINIRILFMADEE